MAKLYSYNQKPFKLF